MDSGVNVKTKRGLILLLTAQPEPWVLPPLQDNHEFIATDDLNGAVKTLNNIRYDLIMLDDTLLQEHVYAVVGELKRRFPTLPLIVLSEDANADYYTRLIRAGVDDLLSPRLSAEELQVHVRLMLKLHAQNRTWVERNQKLHVIASLTRLQGTNSEPRLHILKSINFLSVLFGVEGVAIVLREGAGFRLYAGNAEFIGKNQLFESVLHPGDYDPFLWTIRSQLIQIYEDMSRNPYYVPIPIFADSSAAAIVPMGDGMGAVGVFARSISADDLFIYEQFAGQMTAGLRNAIRYQAQQVDLRTNVRLLEVWRAFANVDSPQRVAEALANAVAEIPLVTRVVAWLFDQLPVDNYDGQVVSQIPTLDPAAVWRNLGYSTNGSENAPRAITGDDEDALAGVFAAMSSGQVIAFPIQHSGVLFVSIVGGYTLDTVLVSHIIQIAVYALQRIELNEEIFKNHQRVLSILVSINEGIFFVDERRRVIMVNPQVTEMTRVPTSAFVNQDVEMLLRAIAGETGTPEQTLAQLSAARERLSDPDDGDFPIVGVTLADGVELLIDFVKFWSEGDAVSWVGVVRPKMQTRTDEFRLDAMFERVSYAHVRSQITSLREQHGHLSYGERQRMLDDIEGGIDRIGRQWDNVIDLYRLQHGGIPIRRETVRVNDVVERVVGSRALARASRQIRVDLPLVPLNVIADEFGFERALTQLLQRGIDTSPPGAPINVRVEPPRGGGARDVFLHIEDVGAIMPPGQLDSPDGENANLSVYIAAELIRRGGGSIRAAANTNGAGTIITISLPSNGVSAESPFLLPEETPEATTAPAIPLTAVGAPQREMSRIMVIKGRSALTNTLVEVLADEDYEVIDYNSLEQALPAVTEAHWDLIVIDMKQREGGGLDACKRIRQKSEVPIILIADSSAGQDKVDGLNAGADDFIASPINVDELLARVRVIFSRRHLPDRMSEPLLIDNLYIDFAKRMVFLDSKPIELTRIEYDLLYTLVMNKGQTVTHKQLLSQVWGPEHQGETQYLWVNISRLRKKLEPTNDSARYIRTQPGVGYFFDAG